ncbi:MAG: phosphopyruvate hydratase [Clostridia bacterium]|nr:phosphopyruvate hydratase [Clostridia bacterium]
MKGYFEIIDVYAREVLDSRGNPTVEATVFTEDCNGSAIVPSGASTGVFEATELRDGDNRRYRGKGVKKAVDNINTTIAEALIGMNVLEQCAIDKKLCELDGTETKSKLGANALLAVSLAAAKTAAKCLSIPLYRYIGGSNTHVLPIPMMNILNGGVHAGNNLDIQEFMIMPIGAKNFRNALRMCSEVYHHLKDILAQRGLSTAVGDEGGFAPNLKNDEEALILICEAIEKAGYKTGSDFGIALDAASSEWLTPEGVYKMPKSETVHTKTEMVDYFEELCNKYPIISIEDPVAEDDWEAWKEITERLGARVQLVGDDLFVTNENRLSKGISEGVANSILIKVNQIGTLSEALNTIEKAYKNGYTAVLSHRSGETEDTTIADIAVAVNCGQIKAGAPCRSERVCKYNRLLRIEEDLCFYSKYPHTLK